MYVKYEGNDKTKPLRLKTKSQGDTNLSSASHPKKIVFSQEWNDTILTMS